MAYRTLPEALVPAGSPRDLLLHVRPEALDEAHTLLKRRLQGRAHVMLTRELIEQGFFGPSELSITQTFMRRAGNLVILPFVGESVYWYERGQFEQNFRGHHGGLTRAEIEMSLLACDL